MQGQADHPRSYIAGKGLCGVRRDACSWRGQGAVLISKTHSSDSPVAMSTPNTLNLASDTILQGKEPRSWEKWPILGTGTLGTQEVQRMTGMLVHTHRPVKGPNLRQFDHLIK